MRNLIKNPQTKYQLAEIDWLAKRYSLDPVDLIDPCCTNLFLRLAYMRKIAQAGQEVENEQFEAHQVEMDLKNKIRS